MFVSMIKYSIKCSSFYFLMMSQDNTYKICCLLSLTYEIKDRKQLGVSQSYML